MFLKVEYKENLIPEIEYILNTLLVDYLGINWKYKKSNSKEFKLSIDGYKPKIIMPSIFFDNYDLKKFSKQILPNQKCKLFDTKLLDFDISLIDSLVPVIYGDNKENLRNKNNDLYLPIDIFGSAFYMLTMYDEFLCEKNNKEYGAYCSYSFRNNFLLRPLLDEYLEILRASFNFLWKETLKTKITLRRINVTCDIDRPYLYGENKLRSSKQFLSNLVKKRSIGNIRNHSKIFLNSLFNKYESDPYIEKIFWIMRENEKNGNKIVFYFLTSFEHKNDGFYNLDSKFFRQLFCRIHERGHTIGLHLNYDSFICPHKTRSQYEKLKNIFAEENINIQEIVSRQHYLRWRNPITARNCENVSIKFDSSVCFPEYPGFKVGTSRDFKYFDLLSRKTMNLIERPLIFMEDSVFDNFGLGLDYSDKAYDLINMIKSRALRFGGQFTMLWHNSELNDRRAIEFYSSLIK